MVAVRTSKPVVSRPDLEEAQRALNGRRQRVVPRHEPHERRPRDSRVAGATPAVSSAACPGWPGEQRELSCLTLHAADLLPIETPWRGTVQSPLMLLETPYRQLIPFSPYDPSIGDANMLFMAKSGGGKTFMAQMFLLMMARANPLISIVERAIPTGRWSN